MDDARRIWTSIALAVLVCSVGCRRADSLGDCADEVDGLVCAIQDAQNFEMETALTSTAESLVEGEDISLDWTDFEQDFLSRPISSCESIQSPTIWLFPTLSTEEVLDGVAEENLGAGTLGAIWECEPTACGCVLSDFSFVGHAFEPQDDFVSGRGTWLLMLSSSELWGVSGLSVFEPDAAAKPSTLSVHDETAELVVGVDWSLDGPVAIPPGADALIDWSDLTVDGWGNPLENSAIDVLRVDRLDVEDSEVAERLVEVDSLSAERWELGVAGATSASLSELAGNDVFSGVDAESTWLLTLWCSSCRLALPRVAVLLEPAG